MFKLVNGWIDSKEMNRLFYSWPQLRDSFSWETLSADPDERNATLIQPLRLIKIFKISNPREKWRLAGISFVDLYWGIWGQKPICEICHTVDDRRGGGVFKAVAHSPTSHTEPCRPRRISFVPASCLKDQLYLIPLCPVRTSVTAACTATWRQPDSCVCVCVCVCVSPILLVLTENTINKGHCGWMTVSSPYPNYRQPLITSAVIKNHAAVATTNCFRETMEKNAAAAGGETVTYVLFQTWTRKRENVQKIGSGLFPAMWQDI